MYAESGRKSPGTQLENTSGGKGTKAFTGLYGGRKGGKWEEFHSHFSVLFKYFFSA